MRVDRDAPPVVGHRERAVGRNLDLDEGGVAGERFVHGIVDGLGEKVVQGLLVGAPDEHAGTPPNRLKPLQHLDVMGGVFAAAVRSPLPARPARGFLLRRLEEVARCGCGLFCDLGHGFRSRCA